VKYTAGIASLAILSYALCAAPNGPVNADDQLLTVVPEILSQQYCYGDADLFSVRLKLRVKYTNRTDRTLILDKEIGKAWFGVSVARSTEDLAAGKYEYNPNIDWFFSDKDQFPKRPSLDQPGPDFTILAPGQTFESNIDTGVFAQYEGPKDVAGSIRSGTHVLQIKLSAWNHPGNPSEFQKSWRLVGLLLTGEIKTGPMTIVIPPNPSVQDKCK
jgi:hypothetical protein